MNIRFIGSFDVKDSCGEYAFGTVMKDDDILPGQWVFAAHEKAIITYEELLEISKFVNKLNKRDKLGKYFKHETNKQQPAF